MDIQTAKQIFDAHNGIMKSKEIIENKIYNRFLNKLIDEAMTLMIAKQDIETRFKARAAKGDITAGIALLDKVLEKREAYDKTLSR